MEFTYDAYIKLMKALREKGYTPIRFCDVSKDIERPAIIRHDIDVDLQEALTMAQYEYKMGIKATYFVLLTSEYYNLLAKDSIYAAKSILKLGHEIGLHFDITAYGKEVSILEIDKAVKYEIALMEKVLDIKIKSISWHIPRKDLLGVHLDFTDECGLYNAYDPYFFEEYKYVSDSMMCWREPIEEYIENRKYTKIQILTHPIWYQENQYMTDQEILDHNRAKRFDAINKYLDNISPGYYSKRDLL